MIIIFIKRNTDKLIFGRARRGGSGALLPAIRYSRVEFL